MADLSSLRVYSSDGWDLPGYWLNTPPLLREAAQGLAEHGGDELQQSPQVECGTAEDEDPVYLGQTSQLHLFERNNLNQSKVFSINQRGLKRWHSQPAG